MPETMTPPAATSATPAPSAAPTPSPAGGDDLASISAAFDKAGYESDPAPDPEPKQVVPPSGGSDKPTPKAADKPATEKPAAKPAEKPAPKDDADPEDAIQDLKELHALRKKYKAEAAAEKARQPKELRKELDITKAERDQERKTRAEFESKIKDLEERGKDAEAIKSKLAEFEKAIKERDAELSVARFEASADFKEKFEKPYAKVWNRNKQYIESLQTTDGKPATLNDFIEVLKSPHATAPAKAREIFGDDHATAILAQRQRLLEMEQDANEAIASEKANWETNRKQREEAERLEGLKRSQYQEHIKATVQKAVEEIGKTVPGYSDPTGEEADTETAALRAKQYELLDAQPQNEQEHALKVAHVRHRFAAFPVLQLQNQRQAARIAELEKELAEAKDTQPLSTGARKPGGTTTETPEPNFAQEMVETLRAAR